MTMTLAHDAVILDVSIPVDGLILDGELNIPSDAEGLVLFAHGSGSSRHSPRNQFVARQIRKAGFGTLLFDLLTAEEEIVDARTAHLRFDIDLLAARLVAAARAVLSWPETADFRIGFFGASTGAAAALVAAAEIGDQVSAVVSRGGRPDLAGRALPRVTAPTLLIVGGWDEAVIELNQEAYNLMRCKRELVIVPHATHLFEEPGKLEEVSDLATRWFATHLSRTHTAPAC